MAFFRFPIALFVHELEAILVLRAQPFASSRAYHDERSSIHEPQTWPFPLLCFQGIPMVARIDD